MSTLLIVMLSLFVLFVVLAVGLVLLNKKQAAQEKEAKKEKNAEEIEKEEAESARKNWMAMIVLFIVTICIAYLLPDDSSMFIVIGAVVLIPLHLMGLWLLFTGSKVSEITKVMVIGYFAVAVVGFILPEPVYQTWKDAKAAVKAANRPTFFKEVFGGSATSSKVSAVTTRKGTLCFSDGNCWMKFDRMYYNVTPGSEGIEILLDNPAKWEELPPIPAGHTAMVHCEGGETVSYWTGGPRDGYRQNCSTGRKRVRIGEGMVRVGEKVRDLVVTVAPMTYEPITVMVELAPSM